MQFDGYDYENLVKKVTRAGRRTAEVGQCVGEVRRTLPVLENDLRFTQSITHLPVKITLPGPLSIVDSTHDAYFGEERTYGLAVAAALNVEAKALDSLGPALIQFDEPAFSRYPEKVKEWGIEAIERAIDGVQSKTGIHICYSYPMLGVPRPIVDSYPVILRELEGSSIDQLALEFEMSGLDPELLKLCPSKTVMFGCISNGSEAIETPEQVVGGGPLPAPQPNSSSTGLWPSARFASC